MSADSSTDQERRISFSYDELDKEVELVLTFGSSQDSYGDTESLCWRVVKCRAHCTGVATLTYTGKTGFAIPSADTGRVVDGSPTVGQQCTMATDNEGKNYFTPAIDDGNRRAISCHIKTKSPADIAFGITNGSDDAEILPIMRYRGIGRDCTLSMNLTPILRVYAVNGYHAQDVITPDLDSNLVLSVDLTSLPHFTGWNVSFDKASGRVMVTRQND